MLTPEEYIQKVEADKAKAQQIIQDNQGLINQFDNLAKKIITDLEETISDFDSLLAIQDEIHAMPKENNLIISDALSFDVTGNIPTTRTFVTSAKKMIIERIK